VRTQKIERVLLVVGLTLLTVWVVARLHRTIASRGAIAEFEAENATVPFNKASAFRDPVLGVPVDFRQWSAKRISAYEDSLARKTDAPLAILRIPKISLKVPIFNNRDGFFRGLQSIAPGDVLELVQPGHSDRYTVSQIRIVTPEDTSVLNPTAVPTLTLVTCFSFYFVGHAPKRYIVTAQLDPADEFYIPAREDINSAGSGKKIRRRKDDLN
jgi:sortase A